MQKNNRQHHKPKELQMANCEWQPVAPDPTGMNAMAGLLGKSDLFRDATGLQDTQDMVNNAMKGSRELVENANFIKHSDLFKDAQFNVSYDTKRSY